MTVKQLFLITFGIEADLPEEILNEEVVSCHGIPYVLEFFEFETVPFPKLYGFNISISTDKHEVKLKLEFDKILELSINDVTP